MPNLSSFLSFFPLSLHYLLNGKDWEQSVPGKIVFLKSNRSFVIFLEKPPPFPTTGLQGTNKLSLACRGGSSHSNHCCLSRKALFRALKSFHPALLKTFGLPRHSKITQCILTANVGFKTLNGCSFKLLSGISFATLVFFNYFSSSLPSQCVTKT